MQYSIIFGIIFFTQPPSKDWDEKLLDIDFLISKFSRLGESNGMDNLKSRCYWSYCIRIISSESLNRHFPIAYSFSGCGNTMRISAELLYRLENPISENAGPIDKSLAPI